MVIKNTIRWKQRFSDFQYALRNLTKGLKVQAPDEVYRAGILQLFEVSFELSWKTMKDYLELEGYITNSPRQAIQQAFKIGIIEDGHEWLDALEKRNLIAHTYDEKEILEIETLIRRKYIKLLKELQKYFAQIK